MSERVLLPLKEAARLLSVSPRTLRRLVLSGVLGTVMLGGRPMVPTSEIQRLAQLPTSSEQAPAETPTTSEDHSQEVIVVRRRRTLGELEVERLRKLRARRTT